MEGYRQVVIFAIVTGHLALVIVFIGNSERAGFMAGTFRQKPQPKRPPHRPELAVAGAATPAGTVAGAATTPAGIAAATTVPGGAAQVPSGFGTMNGSNSSLNHEASRGPQAKNSSAGANGTASSGGTAGNSSARSLLCELTPEMMDRKRKRPQVDCECFKDQPSRCRQHCVWHFGQCVLYDRQHTTVVGQGRCSDGFGPVDCLNVTECANNGSRPGPTPERRWALVFTHSLETLFRGLPPRMLQPAKKFAARTGNTDIILMVPRRGAPLDWTGRRGCTGLNDMMKARIKRDNISLVEVDTLLPPHMKWRPAGAACIGKDLIRLHVLGLQGYAAVAYMDSDTQIRNYDSFAQLLRCAETGTFLTSSGPLSPLNMGLMVFTPSPAFQEVANRFAQQVVYDPKTGWGNAGFAPGWLQVTVCTPS